MYSLTTDCKKRMGLIAQLRNTIKATNIHIYACPRPACVRLGDWKKQDVESLNQQGSYYITTFTTHILPLNRHTRQILFYAPCMAGELLN